MMFPIYGCGALLGPIGKWIDDWLNPGRVLTVKKSDLAVRHGMLYMVLIFVAEYASGAWLRSRGMCPWDYTGRSTNIAASYGSILLRCGLLQGFYLNKLRKRKAGKSCNYTLHFI